eukprot:SAG11_NODE_7407_length_1148_cov_1.342231_1_plen_167_part_10
MQEVWIHTTASMEGRSGPLALPGFVNTLLEKILAGDTDAAGLVAPQAAGLYGPTGLTPPTAIRGRCYKYTFSDWAQLSTNATWWRRAKVKGDTAKVLTAANAWKAPATTSDRTAAGGWIRPPAVWRSPAQRPWLLLLGAMMMAGVVPAWGTGILLGRGGRAQRAWGL